MNKGQKLNKRVWTLFERAGFVTHPSFNNPKEFEVPRGKGRPLDLHAEILSLGVKIIGSNKSGTIKGSWTAHMADCESLRKETGANKCLLVAIDHELDPADLVYAKTLGLVVWTEDNLAYYEELVESIGDYAKYEIIHSLGITTSEESHIHKVLAIKINQPMSNGLTELFAFSISPEHLLKTAVIYRKAQGRAEAYQRMLTKSRLPKIAKFLELPDAILPTDIIVYLDDSIDVHSIKLTNIYDDTGRSFAFSNRTNYLPVALDIPMKYASMEIIDGQHRLYGFVKTSKTTRENFNLVVIGLRRLSEKQKRDTFVAINDNARRMNPNLVAYLKYTEDDILCQADTELMAIRVVVDLNKQTPFKKSIKLLDIGNEKLTLKGLSGYDLKGLLGPRGLLRKANPTNDIAEFVRILRIYFSLIRTEFKYEWSNPDKYLIATNRGITGLLKLLKSILKYEGILPSDKRFIEYARALKKHWKWDTTKLQKAYVGSQGWKEFHRDLVRAIKKDKNFKSFVE